MDMILKVIYYVVLSLAITTTVTFSKF